MKDSVLEMFPKAVTEENPPYVVIWDKPRELRPGYSRALLGIGKTEPDAWSDALKTERLRRGHKQ